MIIKAPTQNEITVARPSQDGLKKSLTNGKHGRSTGGAIDTTKRGEMLQRTTFGDHTVL
ncbi:hypothetical protein AB0346_23470 [Nocardia beijingensis]|uniref:hypothetical protein n=1 Tax=Nocardia beijingensis TaxID=95162 RepID=UPI00344FF0A2